MLEFYKYISRIIIDYLMNISIEAGERYSLQLEEQKDVEQIYNSLKDIGYEKDMLVEDFDYKGLYRTFSITIKGTRLIVAKTDDKIESDFLTFLRNKVDQKGTAFDGTALLFIHNTNLDSILGGSKRLEMKGMPLHVASIEQKLNVDIKESTLNVVDKSIINKHLENNSTNVYESNTSIFDYSEIFEILELEYIPDSKYKDFGMFKDSGLEMFNLIGVDNSLYNRISDNMELYKKIDHIHKYSDLSELEQLFDSNDVHRVAGADWNENNYDDIVKLKEKYDNLKKPLYRENELKNDNKEYIIWDRAEGTSEAKSRHRHIVVFNPDKRENINFKLKFDAKIQRDNIKASGNVRLQSNNRTIEIDFSCSKDKVTYTKLTYFNYTFFVMVLNCSENFLKGIQDKYFVNINIKKNSGKLLIVDESKVLKLNVLGDEVEEIRLTEAFNRFTITENNALNVIKDYQNLEDIDLVDLNLNYKGQLIPLAFKNEIILTTKITPYDVWSEKRLHDTDFSYEKSIDPSSKKESVKLIQGTRSYYPTGEFRRLLDIEDQLIKGDGINVEIIDNEVVFRDISLPPELLNAYNNFLNYFKHRKVLPSLAAYCDELLTLAKKYVRVYFKILSKLEFDTEVQKSAYKEINKLGLIYEVDGENKIHFSPLHPINVIYQINAYEKIDKKDIKKGISQYINSTNLVPYIHDSKEILYKPIDNGLIEWTTFVEFSNLKYNAANRYVPRIVSNKIQDFISHFEYLFISDLAPLKIAVVNLGDCREVLQGIFDYYINELKKVKIEDLRPIEIHIYDEENTISAFEELTGYSDVKEIMDVFNLKMKTQKYDEYDILSMYRNNVHFYKYRLTNIEYNHLTFYKMNDEVIIGSKNMSDIESGMSLDGLISDVSSVFVGDEYVTGFGSKNLKLEEDEFSRNIALYNSFVEYVNKLVTYDKKTVLATAISSDESDLLKLIYKKSHWVTFIDPKVDLNYFNNDKDSQDLMIIHYSDQFTSSSGYDAITVTQRASVYMKIINDFLSREAKMNMESTYNIREIINTFNVFNGEWLLRLVSRQLANNRDQFAREKLSLFSAIKLFEAYNLSSHIYWVPISMEELVRVSGSTGLAQKESIFSPKKFGVTGSFSDDILMVGIGFENDEVVISYYPIEVKIGKNGHEVLGKAKEQVTKAADYLNSELFMEDNFYAKLLRNQLMQIVITQIKKIIMYDMWSAKKWSLLLEENIIEKLVNDQYKIKAKLSETVNDCGIITFTTDAINRRKQVIEHKNNKIDFFDYPLQDAHNYLSLDIEGVCKVNNWRSVVPETTKDVPDVSDRRAENDSVNGHNEPDQPNRINEEQPIYEQEEMKILFGSKKLDGSDVYWLPNSSDKVMHTNTGIIGTMGTGKTQFTKSLITQLKQQDKYNVKGEPVGILIFDYKGDYIKEDFVKAVDAKVYDLYELPFNPLSIYEGKTFKPMLPLHTANELRDTIGNAFSLGNVQKNTLSDTLETAYKSVGIIPSDRSTWSLPAPTIDTVYNTYVAAEYPTNDSLYAALNELYKFKIFESDNTKTKPLFDLIKGVTVINLAGYSESIQNLVVAITLDTFYAQMQAQGHSTINGNYRQLTRFILVDEADNFLSKNFNSIRKILKEGREFGVGTILSTQFLKHFSTGDNKYSEYILTWIIHKVNEISSKEVGSIFSKQDKNEQEVLVNEIKNLEKHYSIVNLGGDNKPKLIRDKAFWELIN